MARGKKVISHGLTAQSTSEISRTKTFMDTDSTNGQMEDDTKESGRTTKCTERESSLSLMGESTRELTETTRRMAEVSTSGQTEGDSRENSCKENSMEQASSFRRTGRGEKLSSRTENVLDGWITRMEAMTMKMMRMMPMIDLEFMLLAV